MALEALRNSHVQSKLYYPGSEKYRESIESYWSLQEINLKPAAVFQPETVDELASGVAVLRQANVSSDYAAPFAVRAGGHSPAIGSSNIGAAGTTIDLRLLKDISINEDKSAVTIGAGNTFEDVYKFLEPFGLCVAGARVAQVGVAGFVLGGGISYYSPTMGFSCDSVLEFQIVLADGSIRTASATSNDDLWRALKGGGNNFGIVTALTMMTVPLERFWGGTMTNDTKWWSKSAEWFHGQATSPTFDKKAALMIMLNYFNDKKTLRHSMKYTSPTPNSAVFQGALDLPSIQSTLREDTLVQLTIEEGKYAAPGQRRLFRTCSFKSNIEMFQRCKERWLESLETVTKFPGVYWCLIFNPITPNVVRVGKEFGGNVLGLSEKDGTVVVVSLYASWANVSDDSTGERVGRTLMENINKDAKELGVFHSYTYMNYAWQDQRVIDGYGSEMKAFLEDVSRKYDPDGVFQRAVPGGFKIQQQQQQQQQRRHYEPKAQELKHETRL